MELANASHHTLLRLCLCFTHLCLAFFYPHCVVPIRDAALLDIWAILGQELDLAKKKTITPGVMCAYISPRN